MKIKGKVVFEDIGMGFWGIKGNNGKNYRPVDMPKSLQKEGLQVEAEVELVEGEMSMFMWGDAVDLKNFKVV